MSGFSVRQIAERIQRPYEDIGTVVDRIRGWADMGLLDVVGDKHPGTGRKRVYAESALIDSLVLTGLTDAGLAAVRVGHFQDEDRRTVLGLGRIAARRVAEAERRGEVIHLAIAGWPSGTLPPSIALLTGSDELETLDPQKPVRQIRSRHHVGMPPEAAWMVSLNLTNIFQPLKQRQGDIDG